MESFIVHVGGQVVDVHCPSDIADTLRQAYITENSIKKPVDHTLTVESADLGNGSVFEVYDTFGTFSSGVGRPDVLAHIVASLTRMATQAQVDRLAFKADLLVLNEQPVIVADTGGPGRDIATLWLAGTSFAYAGSDWVLFHPKTRKILAQQGVAVLGAWASRNLSLFPSLNDAEIHGGEDCKVALLTPQKPSRERVNTVDKPFLLFPHFEEGADFLASIIGPQESAMRLSQCLLNTSGLDGGGFDEALAMANEGIGLAVRFGAPDQLTKLEQIVTAVIDSGLPAEKITNLTDAFSTMGKGRQEVVSEPPKPTPSRGKKRLTIGMATFDDFDGVYFTLQSLRLHHADVVDEAELIVIDNNPTGVCAQALKKFESSIPNFRYVPYGDNTGPAGSKDRIFKEATGDFVLVMDCHVLLAPGSLTRLDAFFREFHKTEDLLQGPIIRSDLKSVQTHWDPVWRKGMLGIWAQDPRGVDADLPPFEIPMQGVGLFACRRDAWPGFNPLFRGFGGEEGYIHEKFRQNGARTLCLPFLRWMHRFERPLGVPYPIVWEDRLRNYLIGCHELGLPTDPVVEHFTEYIGEAITLGVVEAFKDEIATVKVNS